MRAPMIAVVGAGRASEDVLRTARRVGEAIARRGAVLICGGLGGVMTAAAEGAKQAGGVTLGVLPGSDTSSANPFIDFAVATNMGQARNAIIVQSADAVISVAGGYGTLSEIALALKAGKPVFSIDPPCPVPGIRICATAEEAVESAWEVLGQSVETSSDSGK